MRYRLRIGERAMAYAEGRAARGAGMDRRPPWLFESSKRLRVLWLLGWDEGEAP